MSSTLDPDNIPEPDRQLGKGHSNKSLGPSDISDTGSDEQGGLRAIDEPELGLNLERGTNEDSDTRTIEASNENEDSVGTGEDSTAGRDADVDLNADIEVDRVDHLSPDLEAGPESLPEDASPEELQARRRPDAPRQPHR